MRVLVCHNRYRSSAPSGENIAVERDAETALAAGCEVLRWTEESDRLAAAGTWAKLLVAWRLAGSPARRRAFAARLRELRPDVVHLHNPWPLFTYDLALAAADAGIPLVQTLHNYRLIATNDRLVVDGRLRRPGDETERMMIRGCGTGHRGRLVNIVYNRALARWWMSRVPCTMVARYLCLTVFQQELMQRAGIPSGRLTVRPNALPTQAPFQPEPGSEAVFAGRLDSLKGADVVAKAWQMCTLPLLAVGEGPHRALLAASGAETPGQVGAEVARRRIAGARFVIMASRWYEGHPLVLLEAMAAGTPALVPRYGAMRELVEDGVTGRHYTPEDPADLVRQAKRLWDEAPSMRNACREHYERAYAPTLLRAQLIGIYQAAYRPDDTPMNPPPLSAAIPERSQIEQARQQEDAT